MGLENKSVYHLDHLYHKAVLVKQTNKTNNHATK